MDLKGSSALVHQLAASGPPRSSRLFCSVGATDGSAATRRRVLGMGPIVVLLVVLIVLALVGSVAVSPLLLALVGVLVLFAVLDRGRYFARRG